MLLPLKGSDLVTKNNLCRLVASVYFHSAPETACPFIGDYCAVLSEFGILLSFLLVHYCEVSEVMRG